MSTRPKTASLTSGLVAKKGAAIPAAPAASQPVVAAPKATDAYYKALTLRLDRARYTSLKSLSVELDKSAQELLVEALDTLLAKHRGG